MYRSYSSFGCATIAAMILVGLIVAIGFIVGLAFILINL